MLIEQLIKYGRLLILIHSRNYIDFEAYLLEVTLASMLT